MMFSACFEHSNMMLSRVRQNDPSFLFPKKHSIIIIGECFNIKYKILTDIVDFYDLKVIENKLDDFNSLELYFYKNKKV